MGSLVFTHDTLSPRLRLAEAVFHKRMDSFMDFQSEHVQDFMRTNAPWTDQTGNARNGLFAKAKSDGFTHTIVCYHTMPYGIWLEVRHSGQYAIIDPTIQHEGARIMNDLRHFLDKLGVL